MKLEMLFLSFFFFPTLCIGNAFHSSLRRSHNKDVDGAVLLPTWTVRSNETLQPMIYHNQEPFPIRGINFNGIESNCHIFLGLFDHPLSFFLDFLQEQHFNSIRVPIPYEVMNDLQLPIGDCVAQEPTMYPGMSITTAIQLFLDECHKRNLYVLFDLHTIGGVITPAAFTEQIPEEWVVQAWIHFIASVYGHPAFMGIEIKNEPHGEYMFRDFMTHCQHVLHDIYTYLPDYDGLFFISGVQIGASAWGGSYPIDTFQQDIQLLLDAVPRNTPPLVLCPHVYGTSVRGEGVTTENADTWEQNYGFVTSIVPHLPIVPTEIGGFLTASDADYYLRWSDWHMREKQLLAGFYWWTLGPFSQDTGGLFQSGSYEIDANKLTFIQKNTI